MARIFITGSSEVGSDGRSMLLEQGHQVVLHARNEQRGKDALAAAPGVESTRKICRPGTSIRTFVVVSSALISLALCHLSSARIGETLDQVVKRYGHCLRTLKADNGLVYKLFNKSGFKILVHFYEGKVDEISYGKDTDIFDDELKALMQDNAPGRWVGSGWPAYSWHNASGISARYSFEHRLLMIMTDSALEREKKESRTR
jgi:NAD(P)-dependent dehydrogenase (short-subunit alcohol dehydrogenase family)